MTRSVVDALRRHWPILLMLAGAGALYASTLGAYGMFVWDEAEYASIARSLLRGEGFAIGQRPNHLRPPVLPLAGAASMWLTGRTDDRSAKLATVAFSLLALVIVYACATTAYDRATGLTAAVLLGTAPEFWTMTANFLSEIPFLAFFAGAVLWFDLGLRRDPRFFWLSWPCAALALLTRYTAVLFVPFVVARLAASLLGRRHDELRRLRSPAFLLAAGAGGVLVLAWLVRQQWTFGNMLVGFRTASGQLQSAAPSLTYPWDFYLQHLPKMVSPFTAGALLVGVAWGVWRRHGVTLVSALVIGGFLVYFSAHRYKEVRLITAILPFVAIVAAAGLVQVVPGARSRRYGWAVLLLLGALVFAANRTVVQPAFDLRIARGYPPLLQALRTLANRSDADALVMTASIPHVVWYADRRVVNFPDQGQLEDVLARCDWVLITNFEVGQKRYVKELATTLQTLDAPDDVIRFATPRFDVLLVRADFLRQRL